MLEDPVPKKAKHRNTFVFLLIVFISCAILIIVNYLTITILSGAKACIGGESQYSRAQKDATFHLVNYIFTNDTNEWKLYNQEITIPVGFNNALHELSNNGSVQSIKTNFKVARLDERDFDDLIWLYENFKTIDFFEKALKNWEHSEKLIDELIAIGNEVEKKATSNNLSFDDKQKLLKKIDILNSELTVNERNFSEIIASGSIMVKDRLLVINIFFALVIIGSVSFYYFVLVSKLKVLKEKADQENNDLIKENKELDKFVYSASHDLRSPISSLKGLVGLMQSEDDIIQIKEYLKLMDESLDNQDQFIMEIIDYTRNKSAKVNMGTVSLRKIIEESINQNKYSDEISIINVTKSIPIDIILSDPLKLKIIINNLVSNAIKYSDTKKAKAFIAIKAFEVDGFYKIEIEDNGIGISEKNQSKIFDIFFVSSNDSKGFGIGLYLVKDAVEKLNGTIEVISEINIGTKFIVTLPKLGQNHAI